LLIAPLALSVAACTPNDLETERPATSALIANRNLDILFMIDNSSSMRLSQANLEANFPGFMDVLKNLPGGLPNIHVAVVSSDMGAGDGSIAQCSASGGDNGIFKYTPAGNCAVSPLAPNATYLSNVGGVANYTGDISAAFSCIAALGQSGCGFEHQFASVARALGADGRPAPAENQGFLRADALLAIIMVTNEDDCSERPGNLLFDVGTNVNLASQLGPPSNYRCNEFGHACNGVKPPRQAPNGQVGDTVTLQSCTSSECDGMLVPVGEFAARIKALKTAPASEIVVAAIAGAAAPYQVHWKAPSTADTSCGQSSCPWPEVTHVCTATDGSFADPGVRVNQWVSSFGSNGIASSICDASFGPALQQVASRIGALLTAGGGSGGGPGPIPAACATGTGGLGGSSGTGAAGATGAGGLHANPDGGLGGAGGRGGTTGADASVGGHGPMTGGGCQVGGAEPKLAGVALALMALIAGRRRRAPRGATRSR
jgi:MYXO-CTERM domain-containing protein